MGENEVDGTRNRVITKHLQRALLVSTEERKKGIIIITWNGSAAAAGVYTQYTKWTTHVYTTLTRAPSSLGWHATTEWKERELVRLLLGSFFSSSSFGFLFFFLFFPLLFSFYLCVARRRPMANGFVPLTNRKRAQQRQLRALRMGKRSIHNN